MKKPLEDKEIPAAGAAFGLQPAAELDGTYYSYTQIPATATMTQTAQIVLRDGVLVPAGTVHSLGDDVVVLTLLHQVRDIERIIAAMGPDLLSEIAMLRGAGAGRRS